MILQILKDGVKFIFLVYLLTWERVIGLPWLFLFLGLVWLERARQQETKLILLQLGLSLSLAAVYDLSWLLSFSLLLMAQLLVYFGSSVIQSHRKRFTIVLLLLMLVIVWQASLNLSYWSLIQFAGSYLFIILWLKILRVKTTRQGKAVSIQLMKDRF